MFEEAICTIPSTVRLWLGAKVIVNLTVTEGHEAREFKAQYNGQTATVVDFQSVYVGPLDHNGRLPGVYPGELVCIKLSNGHRQWVRPHMLVLNEMVTTKATSQLSAVEPKPLPRKIRYYPDDVVRRQSDSRKEQRTITHLEIEQANGEVFYYLSESAEGKERRMVARARAMEEEAKASFIPRLNLPQSERSDGTGLRLVSRGNVYRLYNSPEKLRFKSDEEELAFWAQSGVSRIVGYKGLLDRDRSDWTLEQAQAALAHGEGDLITKPEYLSSCIDRKGDYHVHQLHDHFAMNRDRVRALMARFREVLSSRQPVVDASHLARKVVGIN